MLKSMLHNKHVLKWPPIGQPIKSHVIKFLFTDMDFHMVRSKLYRPLIWYWFNYHTDEIIFNCGIMVFGIASCWSRICYYDSLTVRSLDACFVVSPNNRYGPVTMRVPASGHQVRCITWMQMGTFNKEIGFLCGLKFFALNIFCGEYLQSSLHLML